MFTFNVIIQDYFVYKLVMGVSLMDDKDILIWLYSDIDELIDCYYYIDIQKEGGEEDNDE